MCRWHNHLLPSVRRRRLHFSIVLYVTCRHCSIYMLPDVLVNFTLIFIAAIDAFIYFRYLWFQKGGMAHFLCCSWFRAMRSHFCKIICIPVEFNFVMLFPFIWIYDDVIGNACFSLCNVIEALSPNGKNTDVVSVIRVILQMF
jgi:hypothetical protein